MFCILTEEKLECCQAPLTAISSLALRDSGGGEMQALPPAAHSRPPRGCRVSREESVPKAAPLAVRQQRQGPAPRPAAAGTAPSQRPGLFLLLRWQLLRKQKTEKH